MNREPDPEGGSGTGDDPGGRPRHEEFDAIVASWLLEGDVPQWPDRPEDRRPDDSRADDARADDARPDDARLDDARLDDARPADGRPADGRLDDARPDAGPGQDWAADRWPENQWPAPHGPAHPAAEVERPAAPLFDAAASDPAPPTAAPARPTPARPVPAAPAPPAPAPPRSVTPEDDEHFVPPEPPPIPRLGPPVLVGLALIALALVLIISPGWVGVPTFYGLPLGLVSMASGLGWLLLRLWPDADSDDRPPADRPDDDDGAVL